MVEKMSKDYDFFQKEIRDNQCMIRLAYLSIIIGFLFYEFGFHYAGISIFIFVCVLSIGFIVVNKIKVKSYIGIFLMTISILLAISFCIYTNPIFRTLNKVFIPGMLIGSFLLLTYEGIEIRMGSFIDMVFRRIFSIAIPRMSKLLIVIGKKVKVKDVKNKNGTIKNILVGLLVCLPVFIVITSILSSADRVFGYYINDIWYNINFHSIVNIVCKVMVSTLVGVFIFSLYSSFWMILKKPSYNNHSDFKFNGIMIITILIMVSILYIIFTKIQICYLYVIKTLPPGFTYSEYARSGFFQLVLIVLINVSSVILLKKNTGYNTNVENKILSSLYSVITILSFNMTFSALYKMKLYIGVFGFTRLRVLVSIFTCFLCMILVLLLIFIWKNINLFKPILVCGVIIYVGINFLNIDEFITKHNINLSVNCKSIDKYYLSTLSFDNYKSMIKARREGLISIENYNTWIEINKEEIEYWYEYNYYCNKGNSIRK